MVSHKIVRDVPVFYGRDLFVKEKNSDNAKIQRRLKSFAIASSDIRSIVCREMSGIITPVVFYAANMKNIKSCIHMPPRPSEDIEDYAMLQIFSEMKKEGRWRSIVGNKFVESALKWRNDKPKMRLTDPQRRNLNIRHEILTLKPLSEPVLLVEDVVSTGATLAEVKRALALRGIRKLVVASAFLRRDVL